MTTFLSSPLMGEGEGGGGEIIRLRFKCRIK